MERWTLHKRLIFLITGLEICFMIVYFDESYILIACKYVYYLMFVLIK